MKDSTKYAAFGAATAAAVSILLVIAVDKGRSLFSSTPGAADEASRRNGAGQDVIGMQQEISEQQEQEIASLRRAVRRLESRSAAVERSFADLATDKERGSAGVADDAPAEEAPEEAAAPSGAVGLEAHFRFADGYRAYAVNERRDPAWSNEKETELHTFFNSGGFKGYSLTSLECKSTLCVVELENRGAPNPAEQPESVRQYLGRAPFAGQSYWAPSEHGLLVVLSREGRELPSPASLEL